MTSLSEKSIKASASIASPHEGEMVFNQDIFSSDEIGVNKLLSIKFLFNKVIVLFKSIKGIFRNKKKLISVMALSLIWLILLIISSLGISNSFFNTLNFLTFAKGGVNRGIVGMVGGIIGKGFFAYFMTILIKSPKKYFGTMKLGFKKLIENFTMKDKKSIAKILFGIGIALVGYNFLTGNASLGNSMIGIITFLISLRALVNKTGFLRSLLISVIRKFGKGKVISLSGVNIIMTGWSLGFVLGIPLSITRISNIGYIAGILLVIVATIIKFFSKSNEEATSI